MGEWNPDYKLKDVVSAEGYVPEDPKYYMETSKMARAPEVTLWDFIEKRPDQEWIDFSKETGANLTDTHNAEDWYAGNYPVERTRVFRLHDGKQRNLPKEILRSKTISHRQE